MRKRTLYPAVAVFCLLVFWGGIALHFPGAAFSRYVEHQVNRDPRYNLSLSPAEFSGLGLSVATAEITLGGEGGQRITFHETEIPVSLSLLNGLTFSSTLGDGGVIEGYWPWAGGEGRIDVESVPLAALPLENWIGEATLEGLIFVQAVWSLEGEGPGRRLTGEVTGRGENWRVAEMQIKGAELPNTRLDEVELRVKLGKVIQVEQLRLSGDAQGTVSGTVTPNWNQMARTSLKLDVKLAIRPAWVKQWGALAPLVEALLEQGRLDGQLRGTVARPAFNPSRRG